MGKLRMSLRALAGAAILLAPSAPAAMAQEGASTPSSLAYSGRLRQREADAALRDLMRLAVSEANVRLADVSAFAVGERYHISLPDALSAMRGDWNAVGRSGALDRLEEAMNRAASAVAGGAGPLLQEKAAALDFYDPVAVIRSGDQAGAKFFAMRARTEIEQRLRPAVVQALNGAGAFAALSEAAQAAGQSKSGAYQDLVVQRTLSGAADATFAEIARIEAELRASPDGRGSPALERVFSRGAQTARADP